MRRDGNGRLARARHGGARGAGPGPSRPARLPPPASGRAAAAAQLSAWAIQLAACWALLAALGLSGQAGIGAAAAVLFAVNVTAVVPATPSNIGVFQLAVISVLHTGFGIGTADALAYGVILQAVEIATAVALGLPALVREGLDLERPARPGTLHRSGAAQAATSAYRIIFVRLTAVPINSRTDTNRNTTMQADGETTPARLRTGGAVLSLIAGPLCVPILRAHLEGPLRLPDLRERIGGAAQTTLRGQVGNLRGVGALERKVDPRHALHRRERSDRLRTRDPRGRRTGQCLACAGTPGTDLAWQRGGQGGHPRLSSPAGARRCCALSPPGRSR